MCSILVILLMAEILHQFRLVVYPIIYRVSAPFQVVIARFQPSTSYDVSYHTNHSHISPTYLPSPQNTKAIGTKRLYLKQW